MPEKAKTAKAHKKPKATRQNRPDPSFKSVVGQLAEQNGFRQLNVELPQLISADLILVKETAKDLSNTLFHFFKDVTLVEFKSENDTFTDEEVAVHLARCLLLYARNKPVTYDQMLALFVSAEKPDAVIEHFRTIGLELVQKEEWLLTCQFGALEIAIVICRLLPLEERYFFLLPFAPATSVKWREFVTMMVEQGRLEILKLVASLKPMEVTFVVTEVKNKLEMSLEQIDKNADALADFFVWLMNINKNNPKEQQKLLEALLDNSNFSNLVLAKVMEISPEMQQKILELQLPKLAPAQILAELSNEQIDELAKLIEARKKANNQ